MSRGEGFEPGSFVVCVEASPLPNNRSDREMSGLARGRVYTVRETGPHPITGRPCVWLQEIIREPLYGIEFGFYTWRFRPLRKLSIDAFLKTEQPVGEDA